MSTGVGRNINASVSVLVFVLRDIPVRRHQIRHKKITSFLGQLQLMFSFPSISLLIHT